ncbi:MAG: hypothetical protein Ct9H90mP5_03580 [Acidimicrobiaceae bacterium]|nr:MAG: hypothetical protein Ct9H90mP5_03580 [Acidimicrobiaceae bacterium]
MGDVILLRSLVVSLLIVGWFGMGPPWGLKSFLTARLMEVWAHGQDILDAIDLKREETDRLHHIAQLGVFLPAHGLLSIAVRNQ